MARKYRIWFPGAKFHITLRGVRRTNIFYDDEDREKYLLLLEDAKNRYPFIIHTYCLMTNHVHLQIELKDYPLSTIMQYTNTKYARYFNRKYDQAGHLFEKRYGAEIIDSSQYELEVSKYIHLNPIKAKMVTTLEEYPWSSYHSYILQKKSPLVKTNQILSYFPEPQSKNYDKYLKSSYTDLAYAEPVEILEGLLKH